MEVIGLSILSGAHLPISKKLLAQLEAAGMTPRVLVGGNIPGADIPALKDLGVHGVFPTGSSFDDIAAFLRGEAAERES